MGPILLAVLRTTGLNRAGLQMLSWLGVLACLTTLACAPALPPNALTNPETGQSIRLSDINAIVGNQNLSEEQKREQLITLGIQEPFVSFFLGTP